MFRRREQGLYRLREKSLKWAFVRALYQGMTSVVPQLAENKGGL
jgi:hypothetical protein